MAMANGFSINHSHEPSALSHDTAERRLFRAARPNRSLILALGDRLHALQHETLQAAAVVGLGRVDVALRVGGDAVDGVELTGHLAAVAEAREDLERLSIEDPYALVLAVS